MKYRPRVGDIVLFCQEEQRTKPTELKVIGVNERDYFTEVFVENPETGEIYAIYDDDWGKTYFLQRQLRMKSQWL